MDMEKHLIIEQQGVLGIISLNRVANLNALSIEMIHQIHMQFETWQQDHSIQAILIKSNSPKAFCAGGDIRYLYDNYKNQTEAHKAYFSAEYDMLNMIRDYQKPVIVILDGYVLGGGFGLAQACHIIVSSEKSRLPCRKQQSAFSLMLQQHTFYLVLMISASIWRLPASKSAVVMHFILI